MTRLSDGPFGPSGKKLAELSDAELEAERERRLGPSKDRGRPTLGRVKQYLANLELGPSATWPEIQRAYDRLRERYHPDKHDDHPERRETALELTESLNKAYEALKRYFER